MCKREAPVAQIFGPFWASKWVKIQVFEYSVEKFGLDSHQSCFICALEILSEMCKIWASKAQFLGHFGPQSKKTFWCLVTFSKSFHWFHNSIASHAHSKYYKMCGEYGPQRTNFWATLGPQTSQNSDLWSFSQKFPTGFASVLQCMSIWATFRGVLNIGPRAPISGSFWAPKYIIIQVILSIIFQWFHIILVLHAYWGYFYEYFNYVPQRLYFWA